MVTVIRNENVITNAAVDLFTSEASKEYIRPSVCREGKRTYIVDTPVLCLESETAGKSGLNNRIYQLFYGISRKHAETKH